MENTWIAVFRADVKRIARDRFLLLIVFYLPLFAVILRWGIPALEREVHDKIDLAYYYPAICGIMVLVLPFMMGCVLGLQLLEEKDEKSLTAVMVTSFSFRRYFVFRSVLYGFVGAVMMVVSHQVMGIVDSISLTQLAVVAVAFALNTPISACIVAILAKNQVQGFAVLKGSGFLFMAPVLSFLVPQPFDLFFGLIPFYWPMKGYYIAVSGGAPAFFWTAIGVSVVFQIAVMWFFFGLLRRKILQT